MRWILVVPLFFLGLPIFSQEKESKIELNPDLHFRSYWMSTSYREDYKNDFALGSSLKLGAKAKLEGFELLIGYRLFANLWSSDLSAPDPKSGQFNRYELGLFDLLNPNDRFFGKIENLSLSYQNSKWGTRIGRMGVYSDWINPQDGRLSATGVEGIHAWVEIDHDWKFELWAISKISVRGTSEWFGVGKTIGIYPVGRNIYGNPSAYFGNTESYWIGILEISKKWESRTFSFSNTLVQNISSTSWFQFENTWEQPRGNLMLGLQMGFQAGIGEGGNPDILLAYKDPEDQNWAISSRIGWKNSRWSGHFNFSKVGGTGRWLSPREWGRDPWYTFIPRERNEGFQNVDAITGYFERGFLDKQLMGYLQLGFHWLPDLDDPAANKYNFPSYRQVNLGMKYKPKSFKMLDLHLILMNKEALNQDNLTPTQMYNKVGLWHLNLILDYYINR